MSRDNDQIGQKDRCLIDEDATRAQIKSYEEFIQRAVELIPQDPTAEEQEAIRPIVAKITEAQDEVDILKARIDFDAFAELVIRDDETGEPIKQAPIHRKWTELCNSQKRLIIWSHINSGKTTQLSIARSVWKLGRDTSRRICILSNTSSIASKIVKAIASYIKDNETVHKVFPHLKPSLPWTTSELQVEREGNSKDPSVRAVGVHGALTSARVDDLVIDDILDPENTGTEKERKKLSNWYKAVAVGRLTRRATILVVGTAYSPHDLLHDLSKQPKWRWFRFPIISNTGAITWPEAWDQARIDFMRAELGPAEFARQLLCRARDDDEARFKQEWIDLALKRGEDCKLVYSLDELAEELSEEEFSRVKAFTGVDLSTGKKKKKTDRSSFFTFFQFPNGDRRLALIESGKFTGPEIIQKVEDTHTRYGSLIAVEDNGAQAYILQFATEGSNVPVVPHTTGKSKRDPVLGVESLAIELANNKWIFPNDHGKIHPEISEFINDMLFFDPKKHTGDRLMSAYFARELARRYGGEVRNVPEVAVRVIGEDAQQAQDDEYRNGVSLKKLFDVPSDAELAKRA